MSDIKIPEVPCEMEMTRRSGESKVFTLRRCVPEDVPMIVKNQQIISDGLPVKDFLYLTTEEDYAESVDNDVCFVFMDGDKMAAFTLMIANRVCWRNYGKFIEDTEEYQKKAVSMDTSFVMPEYRGFGLQKFFFAIREAEAMKLGAEVALTKIHPDNVHSLNNAYKSGFELVKTVEVWGGHMRAILKKDLK